MISVLYVYFGGKEADPKYHDRIESYTELWSHAPPCTRWYTNTFCRIRIILYTDLVVQ